MTDILCRWLNDELEITQPVDQKTFARDFASGYLIGEVLQKYQLQDDFDQFSQTRTADSKLNNFTRIEPVLHLLGIPFDTNLARDVMTEKHGIATRLMYQLYIALTNKKKANLTGVAMETMRPAAPANLNAVESGLYKERLKHITPRQTDLNLDALASRFHEKQIEMEKTAFKKRFEEQERRHQALQSQRQILLEKSRAARDKQSEMIAKIHAAAVHIPKPPAGHSTQAARKAECTKREAQSTMEAISHFEKRMKLVLPPSKVAGDDGSSEGTGMDIFSARDDEDVPMMDMVEHIKPKPNDEYIGKIRKRLEEDSAARQEREKRRRKVLVDQMKAHEEQEEARREEMLVNRLMRQSQQERRIAVQLLQARHEKEVICKNRMTCEKQYEERRLRDFEEAMDRENEMARLAKIEYEEQTRKDQELHDKIAAERAEAKYRKHYDTCMEVLQQTVDFSCKVAEYRELTDKMVPPKLWREWTSLFVAGQPLYEVTVDAVPPEITPEQILEEERQKLLDEGDFIEYKNMVGEWQPPEGGEITGPPRNNPILGHVVQRLFDTVHPPTPPPPAPKFPPFAIKACILGKVFGGKTTCIRKLADEHRLEVLNAEDLIDEAIEAFKRGEMEVLPPETETSEETPREVPASGTSTDTPAAESGAATPGVTAATEADLAKDVKTPDTSATKEGTQSEAAPADVQSVDRSVSGSTSLPASSKQSREIKEQEPVKIIEPQLSARAKLGGKAVKCLKRGRPVEDPIAVEIIVESIRQVPEGTGWIMDGYPTNYMQAKLLEKALTGFDTTSKENLTDKKAGGKAGKRKSSLVPDPRPALPPLEPTSGIDVVVMLDVPDDTCLKRAAGRYQAIQAEEQYHQEFNPPPDGSATGMGKQEKVSAVEDLAHDQEQVQHRITGFLDSWAKMEKWFNKFGNLRVVDASQDATAVHLEVEKILEDTLNKIQGKDQQESAPVESEAIPEEKVEEKSPEVPVEPVAAPPEEETPVSKKGSRSGSGGRSRSSAKGSPNRGKSAKKDSDTSKSPKRGESAKKDGSGKKTPKSRESSPKSPKRGKSGKKGKSPEPEPEPEVPEEPPGPPPPEPGSEEWEFIDQPLAMELAEVLVQHWDTVENTYVTNGKFVFRRVREERENIIRYFYQISKDFLSYLRRPDHKQEFVTQCQKDYNSVPDDMREDEETKAELHQCVDDLRERLWSICDDRKEKAEQELGNITTDGWVDDRLGVLNNHYITLMQGEVDRYQDTVRMLKDYYRGMEGHVPDESNRSYARLPLIELPVERPDSPEKSLAGSEGAPTPTLPVAMDERPVTPKDRAKSPRSKSPKDRSQSPKGGAKSRTPSGKKRDKSKEKKEEKTEASMPDVEVEGKRQRIPLIPRRPLSPDGDGKGGATPGKGKGDKKLAKKAGEADATESPQPPADLDEKLINDCHGNGVSAIAGIMAKELAVRETEEEAERQKELEKIREMEKKAAEGKKGGAAKGGKKGKSRSPSPKKGKKEADAAPTPPLPAAEETEEEKEKKLIHNKMRQEYYFAIQEEETATKVRLELIRTQAIGVLQDLKGKADNAYKDMNDWLGARFLKEMESIDHMSEVMRCGIEMKEKLTEELVLQQEDFLINEERRLLKSASPPPILPPPEPQMADHFTVTQLLHLFQQFTSSAPSGVLSSKSFTETFENMVSVAHGMENLPDTWMNFSPTQIQDMAHMLSGDSEYVDWRRFLLALLHPLPRPSQVDLLEVLERFRAMDQRSSGFVTREQYDEMDMWFSSNPTEPTEEEESQFPPFDRIGQLKKALFDMFADLNRNPQGLDYVTMLLYFSAVPSHREGFFRALSVASGTHMPRPRAPSPTIMSLEESHTELELDKTLETEEIAEEIPETALEALVPLDAFYRVLHHGESRQGDSHRFNTATDPEDSTSREKLLGVFQELGGEEGDPVPFKVLMEHPLIQDVVTVCYTFKALDVKSVLAAQLADNIDAHSTKTTDG